jgi:hypothetical protein
MNVTNTASAAASKLIDLQIGSVSFFNVDKNGQVQVSDGTALLPSITNIGDENTGAWFPAADTFAVSTGGLERFRVASDGNVGIGTNNPASLLDVSGSSTDGVLFTVRNTVLASQYLTMFMGGPDGYGVPFWTNSGIVEAVSVNGAAGTARALYLGAFNGPIIFASASGSRLERARIDTNGNVVVNTGAVATSATNGFLYVAGCAGTPTGVPTAYTGRVPLVVDTTNNKLYFYSGGAWRDAGP